ncbi:hypothetical protein [Actinoplanes couchii]|uniref:Uncharacterized protein n=1 Tax=Actinoplanes couchii TaxID=403638 RepID=A0ABQ3XNB5_9ACTN|nr:hypothetical protein [Actinoplanes couchii]MDR6318093.1 hypothetical protein [Actinoplanes couchii]GID59991.1 hypothetical protein Aco03nite_083950 [Actinoplanes couchii]
MNGLWSGTAMMLEAVVVEALERREWARADQARLRWASCLHRQGRCDDAVQVLQQGWDAAGIGERDGLVVAAMLGIRLLRRCQREDEAGALWVAIQAGTTRRMRGRALHHLLSPANSELHEIGDRTHGRVCAYRHRAGA